jgi:hypothetical protein
MLDDADEERGMNSMGNLDFPPPPPGMSNGKKKSMAGLFK